MSKTKTFSTLAEVGPTFMAVLLTDAGIFAEQADLSAAEVAVAKDMAAAHYTAELDIADVIFDTPVDDDPRWPNDGETTYDAYNFLCKVPGSAFSTPGRYRVEFAFTQAGGEKIKLVFEGTVTASLT